MSKVPRGQGCAPDVPEGDELKIHPCLIHEEAYAVMDECGMTPRQLADANASMKKEHESIKALLDVNDIYPNAGDDLRTRIDEYLDDAKPWPALADALKEAEARSKAWSEAVIHEIRQGLDKTEELLRETVQRLHDDIHGLERQNTELREALANAIRWMHLDDEASTTERVTFRQHLQAAKDAALAKAETQP